MNNNLTVVRSIRKKINNTIIKIFSNFRWPKHLTKHIVNNPNIKNMYALVLLDLCNSQTDRCKTKISIIN